MAPSEESQKLTELFKTLAANFPQDGNSFLERCVYDQVHRAGKECPGVSYEDITIPNGPACKWVRPDNAAAGNAMLFMHGGGFSFGSPNGHRMLTAHLAKACACVALSVDYRLAPQHPYPAPLDDCMTAYQFLLDQGYAPSKIALAGDSCGGGLVTSVPLAAMQRKLPSPAASISLSPLYDVAATGGTMDSNEENDVLNTKPFCAMLADRYTRSKSELKVDPLVSPLFASPEQARQLPPHWISVAGYDMLRDHGERMAEKLKQAGVEVKLEVHDGQQHVFEFMAGNAPEADDSIGRIGKWVRAKLEG